MSLQSPCSITKASYDRLNFNCNKFKNINIVKELNLNLTQTTKRQVKMEKLLEIDTLKTNIIYSGWAKHQYEGIS